MSRSRFEVQIKEVSSALQTVESILSQKKFEKKTINAEPVYVKGDGLIAPMQCVSISLGDGILIIEGWIRSAGFGESELKGFVSMVPKKSLKSVIETIINAVKNV